MDGQWTVPKAAYSCCSLFLKQEVIYATESSRGVNSKVLCVRQIHVETKEGMQ